MKNKYIMLLASLVFFGLHGAEQTSGECRALADRVVNEVDEILTGVVAHISPQSQLSLQIMLGLELKFEHTMTGHDRDKFESFSKKVSRCREDLERCKKNDCENYCRIALGLSALRRFELYDSIRREMEEEAREYHAQKNG